PLPGLTRQSMVDAGVLPLRWTLGSSPRVTVRKWLVHSDNLKLTCCRARPTVVRLIARPVTSRQLPPLPDPPPRGGRGHCCWYLASNSHTVGLDEAADHRGGAPPPPSRGRVGERGVSLVAGLRGAFGQAAEADGPAAATRCPNSVGNRPARNRRTVC